MRSILKSDFLWQFVAGFALGAVGVFGLQSTASDASMGSPVAAVQAAR